MEDLRVHLQPKQRILLEWLLATGRSVATILGIGGAKGGGKSAGVRNCALLLCSVLSGAHPGVTVTIVRRVFDDLKKNHIDQIFRAYPDLQQYYYAADKEIRLPNGTKIIFAFAETTDDVKRKFLGGYESAFIFVDEAQQFTQEELQWISTAARWTTTAHGVPPGFCKTIFLFNPGGRGSEYIRRIFWLKEYERNEQPHSYAFLHTFGWDNYEWFRGEVDISEDDFYDLDSETRFALFIRDTSEGRKYDAFPEDMRLGYLLGSFEHFSGQYFAGSWNKEKAVISKSLAESIIQPWWTRWMAQDWGYGDHDAHGWFAMGKLSPSQWVQYFGGECDYPMDVVIAYREHITQQRAEADLATDIVTLTPHEERGQVKRFFLSQDAFGQKAKQGSAHSVGEQFSQTMRRYSLPTPEPADQDRVVGWRFMFNCLRQSQLRNTNVGEDRAKQGPALFVSAECPNIISCIPMAVRDEDDVDDVMRVPGVLWEDVTDMVRYGLKSMLRPKSQAPRDVRAREVYEAAASPTQANLAILRFKDKERQRSVARRAPGWR